MTEPNNTPENTPNPNPPNNAELLGTLKALKEENAALQTKIGEYETQIADFGQVTETHERYKTFAASRFDAIFEQQPDYIKAELEPNLDALKADPIGGIEMINSLNAFAEKLHAAKNDDDKRGPGDRRPAHDDKQKPPASSLPWFKAVLKNAGK